MKNIALALMAICLSAPSTTAQNFYLKAGAGYAFPMPGQKIDQYGHPVNTQPIVGPNGYVDYEVKNASFTSGLQVIVGGGYMLSPNLGVELDVNLNVTSPTYTYSPGKGVYTPYNSYLVYPSYNVSKHSNNTLLLMPSLVMQTSSTGVKVYTRIGAALPLSTRIRQVTSVNSLQYEQYTWEVKHYFSLGFTATAGVKVNLNNYLSVFGEMSMLYLSPARKEQNLEFAEINGTKLDPSMVKGIPTTYYFNKTVITNANYAAALPEPFSNLSASVGISYKLTKAGPKNKH